MKKFKNERGMYMKVGNKIKSKMKDKLKDIAKENMERLTKNITIDRLKNKFSATLKIILCSMVIAVMSTGCGINKSDNTSKTENNVQSDHISESEKNTQSDGTDKSAGSSVNGQDGVGNHAVKSYDGNNIIYTYPINDIAVNPFYGTICTAGGDGNFTIWDLEKRRRIIEKKNLEDKTPLTACEYNKMGDLLVYASGYDWSKGAQYAHLYPRPKIYVHYVKKNERKSS